MTDAQDNPVVFEYRAQASDGAALSGVIEAADAEAAAWRLQTMGLTVVEIEPVLRDESTRRGSVDGDDFAAFNEQLAMLAEANMPIEHGLRLIAEDLQNGRLADSVRLIARELESGRTLPEAFDQHRDKFPSMYAELVEVGIASGNLGSTLLNLSRHLAMTGRLRAALWRAAAYPLMVIAAMAVVMMLIGWFIVPQFQTIYADFDVQLPVLTRTVMGLWATAPVAAIAILLAIVAFPAFWRLMRAAGREGWFLQTMVLPIPVVGRMLRRNIAARWCDLVGIGVAGGMDLPRAMRMAGRAIGLPGVIDDSDRLSECIESGATLEHAPSLAVLPLTTPQVMAMAQQRGELDAALLTLRNMYDRQAEHGLGALQGLLGPVLLILLAGVMGVTITALFLPLVKLIQSVTG